MSVSYLPYKDADRVVWLNNFSARLGQYANSLGLTAAEVNSVQEDAAMFAYMVQLETSARQYWTAVLSAKKQFRNVPQQVSGPNLPDMPSIGPAPAQVNSGIFNRIFVLVIRIKQSVGYNNSLGQDLNIVPPAATLHLDELQPDLKVRLSDGRPLLKWKRGNSDALHLYVDRRDNKGFVLLATVIRNSYLDTTALPPLSYTATWDYKAKYLIGDDEVGIFSPVISISVVRAGN